MLRLDIGQPKVPLALQDSALRCQMGSKERSHLAHMGVGWLALDQPHPKVRN